MRRALAAGVARRSLPRPPQVHNRVICVGGLSIGGAGRTPVVAYLARLAKANGLHVGIVGHGYRARIKTPGRVDAHDALRFGDEAVALAQALPDVPVWVGPTRAAVLAALPAFDVILTDGGLLDTRLARQQTILVVDATASTQVLPAGPLRAPLDAVEPDWRWLHRVDEPEAQPHAADLHSRFQLTGITLPDGRQVSPEWLHGRAMRLMSGIARPGSFHHAIRAQGAQIRETVVYADHQPFSTADLRRLSPDWCVTAKDRARLPANVPVCTAHGEVVVTRGNPLLILKAICDFSACDF